MSLCKSYTLVITSPPNEKRRLFVLGDNPEDKNREKDKQIFHLEYYDHFDPYRAYVFGGEKLVVLCGYSTTHSVFCNTCKQKDIDSAIYMYKREGEMNVACFYCYEKKKVTLPPLSFYLKYPIREMQKLMNHLKETVNDEPDFVDLNSNKTEIFPSNGRYTCMATGEQTFKNVVYMLCN